MRIYVLITQMRPLKVYLYKEGIVRFSSERYNTDCLQNVFSHLTNSSINKYAATNISDGHGTGLKWSFAQLRSYFSKSGYDYDMMWAQIEQIIQLTCVNLCSLVPDLKCCFELFGFDIMLDEYMKPWLLEVNSGPAMSVDC
jgi:tubulin polyglutamylase TTLL2